MTNIGYARVSTKDQHTDLQLASLKQIGCEQIFEDHVSAVGRERPGFEKALSQLKTGDCLCIWKLDRAFRSTVDAINVWDDLLAKGIHLHVTTLGVLSGSPEGKLFFRCLISASEFERDLISVRTSEGMLAAKARGVHVGRPRALTKRQVLSVKALYFSGYDFAQLASTFDVSQSTIRRTLKGQEGEGEADCVVDGASGPFSRSA